MNPCKFTRCGSYIAVEFGSLAEYEDTRLASSALARMAQDKQAKRPF